VRITLGLAALLVAGAAAVGARSAEPPPSRTVPCDEIIGRTAFPHVGNSSRRYRNRTVLGMVSVPPAYIEQIVPTGERPWAYWTKWGIVVRASGDAVTITVPRAWRSRVGIEWGYGGNGGPFSSLRIAGCGSNPAIGNAYSGGFHLRARAACVPLVFRARGRQATVRFGLGRRCP
jgi:hypothetical protein